MLIKIKIIKFKYLNDNRIRSIKNKIKNNVAISKSNENQIIIKIIDQYINNKKIINKK